MEILERILKLGGKIEKLENLGKNLEIWQKKFGNLWEKLEILGKKWKFWGKIWKLQKILNLGKNWKFGEQFEIENLEKKIGN